MSISLEQRLDRVEDALTLILNRLPPVNDEPEKQPVHTKKGSAYNEALDAHLNNIVKKVFYGSQNHYKK